MVCVEECSIRAITVGMGALSWITSMFLFYFMGRVHGEAKANARRDR